jgi:hypothetical protein
MYHAPCANAQSRVAWILLLLVAAACATPKGELALRVVSAEDETEIPARIELVDENHDPVVLQGAIALTLECTYPPPPSWAPWSVSTDRIENPHTGTVQFYVDSEIVSELAAGSYSLRVFHGVEHRVVSTIVEIDEGRRTDVTVRVERFVDMPTRGWYSADPHLHITRRRQEDSVRVGRWLRAEDLHVGNLLQMGSLDHFEVTPQPGFGEAGEHREGNTLLIAGQEHPRTHVLGHTITLGADEAVDFRDAYLQFDRFAAAAREHGGAFGFAHHGVGNGARDGVAVFAADGWVDFLEVLQFEWPHYEVWYGLLDLGLRVTPTAGTDFPCGDWSMPGRERFYTKIKGPLTRASWIEGIRAGRTFVTNGPLLTFQVDDTDIGGTVALERPGSVRVQAEAEFDPERDDVKRMEVLRNGEPIPATVSQLGPGRLGIDTPVHIDGPSWFALRVSGDKVGETPAVRDRPGWLWDLSEKIITFREMGEAIEEFLRARGHVRPAAAHTAAIWVELAGEKLERPLASSSATRALERLDQLDARLEDTQIDDEGLWDWLPYSDGVSVEHLRKNREALRAAIARARSRYQAFVD